MAHSKLTLKHGWKPSHRRGSRCTTDMRSASPSDAGAKPTGRPSSENRSCCTAFPAPVPAACPPAPAPGFSAAAAGVLIDGPLAAARGVGASGPATSDTAACSVINLSLTSLPAQSQCMLRHMQVWAAPTDIYSRAQEGNGHTISLHLCRRGGHSGAGPHYIAGRRPRSKLPPAAQECHLVGAQALFQLLPGLCNLHPPEDLRLTWHASVFSPWQLRGSLRHTNCIQAFALLILQRAFVMLGPAHRPRQHACSACHMRRKAEPACCGPMSASMRRLAASISALVRSASVKAPPAVLLGSACL